MMGVSHLGGHLIAPGTVAYATASKQSAARLSRAKT
jgi:hypothetical protein